MKPKLVGVLLSLIALLSLTGCMGYSDTDQENDNNEETGQNSNDVNPEESMPEPPELTIIADGETGSAVLGTYSWTVDNEDGTQTSIEADSAAPPELVRTTEPLQVTEDITITLEFEEEPNSYTIRIWDEDNNVLSESDEVDLSGEGEVIHEVVAHWPQGTASYAFSLFID